MKITTNNSLTKLVQLIKAKLDELSQTVTNSFDSVNGQISTINTTLSSKPSIDDVTPSATAVYSSQKIQELIADKDFTYEKLTIQASEWTQNGSSNEWKYSHKVEGLSTDKCLFALVSNGKPLVTTDYDLITYTNVFTSDSDHRFGLTTIGQPTTEISVCVLYFEIDKSYAQEMTGDYYMYGTIIKEPTDIDLTDLIDDSVASTNTVYSSSKTDTLLSAKADTTTVTNLTNTVNAKADQTAVDTLSASINAKPSINDSAASTTSVYSSSKVDELLASSGGKEYSISFDLNGGSMKYSPTTYNSMVGVSLPTPKREGYRFDGWIDYDGTIIGWENFSIAQGGGSVSGDLSFLQDSYAELLFDHVFPLIVAGDQDIFERLTFDEYYSVTLEFDKETELNGYVSLGNGVVVQNGDYNDDGNHEYVLGLNTLTEDTGSLKIIYFDPEVGQFNLAEITEVNHLNKTISLVVSSQIAILCVFHMGAIWDYNGKIAIYPNEAGDKIFIASWRKESDEPSSGGSGSTIYEFTSPVTLTSFTANSDEDIPYYADITNLSSYITDTNKVAVVNPDTSETNSTLLRYTEVIDGGSIRCYFAEQPTSYTIKSVEIRNASLVSVQTAALISFTIDGTSYQAEEGMTWGEWVNSSYDTGNFYTIGTSVCQKPGADVYAVVGAVSTSAITANSAYFTEPWR